MMFLIFTHRSGREPINMYFLYVFPFSNKYEYVAKILLEENFDKYKQWMSKEGNIGEYWQTFRDFMGVTHILSTYFLSHIIDFPDGDLFQVGVDTFIQCLAMPESPIGNVLIIQGGAKHMGPESYYVRTASIFMDRNIRIFLFEKNNPVINYEYSHDIADAIKFIKKYFSGPLVVIGYSMGGMFLLSYLAMGYNQADLYIPTCCSFDLRDFVDAISNDHFFNYMERRECRMFGVETKEELCKISGTTWKKTQKYMDSFANMLNSNIDGWIYKLIYIIGSEDPLSKNYEKCFARLNKYPFTYIVKGGWHCCLNTIFLTSELVSNYLNDLHHGLDVPIKKIRCR